MNIHRHVQKIFLLCFLALLSIQMVNAKPAKDRSDAISDSVITGKIKAKIALDPAISVFNTHVNTHNGVVDLTAVVNSDTDASALIEIAQSTDGVKDVDATHLQVKNSAQPFTDTVITAKVKGLFLREKISGKEVAASVSVETNNGIVYLSGTVDNEQEAHNAIRLAKTIHGVKQVESRIKVQIDQVS